MTAWGELLRRGWDGILAYLLKFGVVGALGLVIDVALFNALRLGVFGDDTWAQSALGAKTISTCVAIVFNWLGNRFWTFRHHRRRHVLREFAEYVVVSVGGMGISLACLWISHHLLGFTSLLADNISTNVVGLGLGTAFRFVLYRYWVFGHHRSDGLSNLARVEEAQRALFEEPPFEEDLHGRRRVRGAAGARAVEPRVAELQAQRGSTRTRAARYSAPPTPPRNQGG